MRFAREKDLAPDRMWTSPEIPVRGGNLVATTLATNFQFYLIRLACAARNTIRLKLHPTPKDARMRLMGIVNNHGKRIEHTSGFFGDDEFDAQWNMRTLPSDPQDLRKLIGATPAQWRVVWPYVQSKFPPIAGGRQNAKLEAQKQRAIRQHERQSDGGTVGSARRWRERPAPNGGAPHTTTPGEGRQ